MKAAGTLTAGFLKMIHVFSVPLKLLFNSLFNPIPSNSIFLVVNVTCFLHWPLIFGHISCIVRFIPLQYKSHHAEFDNRPWWPRVQFPFFSKSSPLVNFLVNNWLLDRPQKLHFSLTFLSSLLILGFPFLFHYVTCITVVRTSHTTSSNHLNNKILVFGRNVWFINRRLVYLSGINSKLFGSSE